MIKLKLLILFVVGTVQLFAQPLNNHLQFDGVNDYISLNKMDVSGNTITLEALINSTNLNNCSTGDCRIISKASGLAVEDHYWMLSTFRKDGNIYLRFRLKTNGNTATHFASAVNLSDNTWYHVAATYDGTTIKLFLDGTQISSTSKSGNLTTNSNIDAWIGNNPKVATSRPWQGAIDEVRIWNIARTQAQLQANRNTELSGTEAGLQAYYTFNEGAGQTINDQAGNNNTFLGSTNSADVNDPSRVISNMEMNTLNLKLLLEGAITAGQPTMTTTLLQQGVMPQGQPYTNSPWNYPGTEGSGWQASDYPAGAIDWVLVSLRTSLDPTTEVARAAAVLLQDGTLSPVDLDLSSIASPVHIMVEHRNHLPIITNQAIPIVNNTLTHDFTTEDSHAPTGFGQKRVGNHWMMYAGNADQTDAHRYDINAADLVFWETVNGLGDTYNAGDYNLDADVNDADRLLFTANNGIYSGLYEATPPDTIIIPDCSANSYASIEAAAPSWNCLETHNEYLGAFLAQNPDVAFWNQDTIAQCIEAIIEPPITGTVVSINSTGQNDTNLIKQAAVQAGSGGLVDGNGETYKISTLVLTSAAHAGVTFKDIKLEPFYNKGSTLVVVDVPDVTFISCPLDMQDKNYSKGFEIRDNADRFAMVNGGIYNFYNTYGWTGDMLRINEGVDDVYIVNNEFIKGIGLSPLSGEHTKSKVRAIRVSGNSTPDSKVNAPKRGIIASNLFENLQADGGANDSDAMVFGGFDVELQYAKGQRMVVMANIGIDAGKRLMKLQSGGIDAHSNFNWWRDANGPLGERVTRAHYDNQGTSNTRWTNNSARSDHNNTNSESYFMTMQNHFWSGKDFQADNVVFSCNMYEHNADTSNERLSYAFSIYDRDPDTHDPDLSPWPLNSEVTNNVITGTGVLKNVWWFRTGDDPLGTQFTHKPNSILVEYENLYR